MTKNRMERARRAAVVLVAAGLFTTGCTVDGDAAAQVGTDRWTQAELSAQTDAVMTDAAPADRAVVNRAQLTTHIRHQLLQDLATARQIVVSDAEIQSQLAEVDRAAVAAQLGVTEADLPRAAFDAMVLQQVAESALQQPLEGEVVTIRVEVLRAADRAEAQLLQAQLQGPGSDRIAEERSGEWIPSTMSNVDPASAGAGTFGVFSASVGDVLVVEENDQFLIVRIQDRSAAVGPIDLQPFTQLQNGLELVTPLLLADQAQESGVTVNPRFGRWDPVAVAVVQ